MIFSEIDVEYNTIANSKKEAMRHSVALPYFTKEIECSPFKERVDRMKLGVTRQKFSNFD
jgi:hypothetical protein